MDDTSEQLSSKHILLNLRVLKLKDDDDICRSGPLRPSRAFADSRTHWEYSRIFDVEETKEAAAFASALLSIALR